MKPFGNTIVVLNTKTCWSDRQIPWKYNGLCTSSFKVSGNLELEQEKLSVRVRVHKGSNMLIKTFARAVYERVTWVQLLGQDQAKAEAEGKRKQVQTVGYISPFCDE